MVHGLPIRPAFSKGAPPRSRLRQQLGLRPDVAAVLLVGGGEGMGPLEATITSIAAASGPRIQLVVICGRNERLIKRLSEKVVPPPLLTGPHPLEGATPPHTFDGEPGAYHLRISTRSIAPAVCRDSTHRNSGPAPCALNIITSLCKISTPPTGASTYMQYRVGAALGAVRLCSASTCALGPLTGRPDRGRAELSGGHACAPEGFRGQHG